MRPTSGSSQVRHDRRDRHRGGNRAPRQAWVPRGAALPTPSTIVASPSPEGGETDRNPGRWRSDSARQSYVVRIADKETPEHLDSGESSIPQLVQEIQDKLSKGTVECMICYDMVRRSASIWSCSSCYSIFHLPCIKKWARAPTSIDVSAEKDQGLNWRCPGCQSVQLVASKDMKYTCFCGKRPDPPSDLYLTPHSCGEPCGKPLERVSAADADNEYRCFHTCVLQCHPGPCPPCKVFAPPQQCPCGKMTIIRRCSDRKSIPSCGLRCDKLLECGRHRCQRLCHVGACDPCQVLAAASCFCRKKAETVLCGGMPVKGEIEADVGLFACNSVCGRILSCGNHDCAETCHPGPCGECELIPGKIKTCYCGKTPMARERNSCLDPVPTCLEICGKTLRCGLHKCKEKCHAGDCPPCLVIVEQKCRCQSTSQTVECCKTTDDDYEFVCEKQCGRKKNCGRHRCSERCCPLSSTRTPVSAERDPHLCTMLCGKRLRCGQHSCESLCHSGHCPPCLETIFSDLSCACGNTVIPPPLPCGTPPPSCSHPCSVAQPCGHSATHSCHFGDCPPCTVPVAKECIGGHVVLRNIPCGSKGIRCNQLCGKTRQCGMHACARICHPPPCDSSCSSGPSPSGSKLSCGQVCGAPRRDCRHACTATCHPFSPCPDLRCDFPVIITCSCGRLTASVPCDAGGTSSGGFQADSIFEAAVMQKLPVPLQPVEACGKKIPLGQRKLICDEDCAKLERKRVLAEAFDIAPPNLDALHFGENSMGSELLQDLFRRESKWVMAVEDRFKYLVTGKAKSSGTSSMRAHVFSAVPKEKRDATRLIAERWKLSVHAAGWEPRRFLVVHVTPKSKAPARIIGHKHAIPAGVQPTFDPSIDMDPRLVVALFDLPRDADISALVLRFGGECELVWLNDKNAMAIFSDPVRAATALRRLDHGSVYHGAVAMIPGPSSAANNSGLGSAKEVGATAMKASNPWKEAVVQEVGWNEDSFRIKKEGVQPISVSFNRWNVLESDPHSNHNHNLNGGGHQGQKQGDEAATSSGSSVASSAVVREVQSNEVEDWEKAYD